MKTRVESSPIPPSKCTSCGLVSDIATGEEKPVPGAYLICFGCGLVTKVNIDWTLLPVSEKELAGLPEVQRWQNELRALRHTIS